VKEKDGSMKRARRNDQGDQVYYHRFFYQAHEREFRPQKVALFCRCAQPYNPDDRMVECDTCGLVRMGCAAAEFALHSMTI